MSIVCPGCKHEIDSSSETVSTTDIVCPKCRMEFMVKDSQNKNLLEPGSLLGGYEIVRLIGSGGMGRVYEAVQLSLQRKVALKVIQAEVTGSEVMARRFLQEVRATASLEHPGIVTVFEASQEDTLLYLAMELVEGVPLDSLLKASKGPIMESVAWNYAVQVCDAMNYAWKYQQLLHRDIKPANIMVLGDDRIKICDLGIAKRGTDDVDASRHGMAIGTPHYMSPEQGQGLANLDFRTDVYSLGASLYHLTTGRVPFPGMNAITVITSHIVDELADPQIINSELSKPTAKLITLMMAKKPKDRHPSWEALRDDIIRVLEGDMPLFEPEPEKKSGSSSSIRDEVIVPAKDARNAKRTMVDMKFVRNELKLNAKRNDTARSGWQLVRVGYLTVFLVALVGAVTFQYRKEFLPEMFPEKPTVVVPQILLLDDGTAPAPDLADETGAAAYNAHQKKLYLRVLATLNKTGTSSQDAVEAAVAVLTENHEDGLSFSRYCAAEGDMEAAIAINEYVLKNPERMSSTDLGRASLDLVDYLQVLGRTDDVKTVLLSAIEMNERLPEPYAASVHIRYAECCWQSGAGAAGCDALKRGLDNFAQSKRMKAAEMVAISLIRYAQHTDNKPLLAATCTSVKDQLPKDCEAVKLASSLLRN